MPPATLRPRSTTEIIDASVSLLRQHYWELVAATGLFTVPLMLISVLAGAVTGFQPAIASSPFGLAPQVAAVPSRFYDLAAISGLMTLVLWPLAAATTVAIVSDAYLGHEVTIANALRRAVSRFWAVVFTGIAQGILTLLGFLCFLIPGFFCMAWFFSSVNIVVVEGKDAVEALGRGRALAKGSVGRILGALSLCGLLTLLANVMLSAVVGVLIQLVHTGPQAAALAQSIGRILVYPFFMVVTTLLYYDLRIRKEGLDLELMAQELAPLAA